MACIGRIIGGQELEEQANEGCARVAAEGRSMRAPERDADCELTDRPVRAGESSAPVDTGL